MSEDWCDPLPGETPPFNHVCTDRCGHPETAIFSVVRQPQREYFIGIDQARYDDDKSALVLMHMEDGKMVIDLVAQGNEQVKMTFAQILAAIEAQLIKVIQ